MKRITRFLLLFSLTSLIIGCSFCGLVIWFALEDLPDLDALKNYQPAQSTFVYDHEGELIGRFYDERRTVVPIKSLPRYIPLAFVAAEDGDFFSHNGIDYFGVLRAVILEFKHRTIGGRRVGGSTITQQTARAMLLNTKQTYVRKIKEMVLAQRIEKALSKEDILHLYLNQIYFGNGAYGVEEASITYFGKHAHELALFEAASLAAIPKSPNRINPFGDTERLKIRQAYVLEQMIKCGFIREQDAKKASEALLFSEVSDKKTETLAPYFLSAVKSDLLSKVGEDAIRHGGIKVYSTLDIKMQKNAEKALREGLKRIDKRAGYRGPLYRPNLQEQEALARELNAFKKHAFVLEDKGSKKVWNLDRINKNSLKNKSYGWVKNIKLIEPKDGLVLAAQVAKIKKQQNSALIDVGSSLIEMPFSGLLWASPVGKEGKKSPLRHVSEAIRIGDIVLVKLHKKNDSMTASLEQEPIINGGLVSLDVKSGAVLAMVGGNDFNRSSFNRIMQAKRQPGSGIKPLIYAQAIDQNKATVRSIITDAPRAFFDPGSEEFWRPRNHTNKFLGDITLRKCLRSSINTCTITLLEMVGLDQFLTLAKELQLSTELTPYPRNLTIALGSAESIPINVANAMRILPNQGFYSPYFMMNGFVLKNGEQTWNNKEAPRSLVRPEAAFIVTDILKEVIRNQDKERYLSMVNSELAGKTGTTNNARSVWFTGYSPKILTLVFVGYDDNRSLGNEWGVTTAFPIWAEYMNSIPAHHENLRFEVPANIEWRNFEESSHIGSEATQKKYNIKEPFIIGTAPEEQAKSRAQEAFEQSSFAP